MKRILVVDDEFLALSEIKVRLEQYGYEVETAKDGKEALLMLDNFRADLAIIDLVMPGMTGDKLIKILWGRYPQLPIILIGNVAPESHQADLFIPKPIDFSAFESAVKQLLPI